MIVNAAEDVGEVGLGAMPFSLAVSFMTIARAKVFALVSAPVARQGFGKAKISRRAKASFFRPIPIGRIARASSTRRRCCRWVRDHPQGTGRTMAIALDHSALSSLHAAMNCRMTNTEAHRCKQSLPDSKAL